MARTKLDRRLSGLRGAITRAVRQHKPGTAIRSAEKLALALEGRIKRAKPQGETWKAARAEWKRAHDLMEAVRDPYRERKALDPVARHAAELLSPTPPPKEKKRHRIPNLFPQWLKRMKRPPHSFVDAPPFAQGEFEDKFPQPESVLGLRIFSQEGEEAEEWFRFRMPLEWSDIWKMMHDYYHHSIKFAAYLWGLP